MSKLTRFNRLLLLMILLAMGANSAYSQTSAFTYQGKLADSGNLANGQYDLQFKLFDTVTLGTGSQRGGTVTVTSVNVAAGVFTVQLDFGSCSSCFDGSARFLEIGVKQTSGSTFTTLGPRQPVTSTPYAIKSQNAATADGLSVACVNCVTSSQVQSIQGSQVAGNISGSQINTAIPVASVPAGSGSYIQNGTAAQASSNFSISGNGTAGGMLSGSLVNSDTQYNLAGNRVLSGPGTLNLFAGAGAGASNGTGLANAFFGASAGSLNTSGQFNSFFGADTGNSNTTGNDNAFFGAAAGDLNTTGNYNSFFGTAAGFNNTNGSSNAFFGRGAGAGNTTASSNAYFGAFAGNVNTTGANNSFFGEAAGGSNTTGGNNSFLGSGAGPNNSTGSNNVFVGGSAGIGNSTGSSNTIIGKNADVGSSDLVFATALGSLAMVAQSNSLVLGSINGVNNAIADTNVGIGTTTPNARFHIAVNSGNTLFGDGGCPAGYTAIGFGSSLSGCTNYSLSGNGTNTIVNRPAGGQITFREDNAVQMTILSGGAVRFEGIVAVGSLNATGATTTLCRTSAAPFVLSSCTSSLRYKTNIAPFSLGLNLIDKLQPITFDWKADGMRDVGFGAEDVARVNPLLVTYNAKGEVEGVKYDRLSVAFVNAFKEQQAQIQRQQEQIKSQQNQIDALRKLICLDRANADVCK